MTTSTPSSEKTYFNLHTQGFGYLSRVRTVTPKKGEPFLACDINALNGPSDSPDYRRFDVTVTGTEAQHLVRRCENAANGDRKVLIGFRLGDLWPDLFTYSSGDKKGTQGVSMKARLLHISWIKVDGKLVYKYVPKTSEQPAQDDAPAIPCTPPTEDVPTSEASDNTPF